MADSISLREERDVSAVINHTVAYFRQHFRSLVRVLTVIAGPAVLLLALVEAGGRVFFSGSAFAPGGQADIVFSYPNVLYILFYVLGTIVAYFLVQIATCGYLRVDDEAGESEPEAQPGAASVWKVVRARLWSVLGGVLIGMAVIGLPATALVLVGSILMVGASQGSVVGSLLGLAMLFIGTMAWFAWMAGRLCVYFPVLVMEDGGPIAGFKRSWQLTKGVFWRSLGVLLLVTVIVYILTIGFSIPVLLAEVGNEFLDLPLTVPLILLDSIVLVATILVQAGYWLTLSLYYFSLVEEKDASGLMDRIEALEEDLPPGTAPAAAPEAGRTGDAEPPALQ